MYPERVWDAAALGFVAALSIFEQDCRCLILMSRAMQSSMRDEKRVDDR